MEVSVKYCEFVHFMHLLKTQAAPGTRALKPEIDSWSMQNAHHTRAYEHITYADTLMHQCIKDSFDVTYE